MLIKPEGKSSSVKYTISSFARSAIQLDYIGIYDSNHVLHVDYKECESELLTWLIFLVSNRMDKTTHIQLSMLDKRCDDSECEFIVPEFKGFLGLKITNGISEKVCGENLLFEVLNHVVYVGVPIILDNDKSPIHINLEYQVQEDERNGEFICKIDF